MAYPKMFPQIVDFMIQLGIGHSPFFPSHMFAPRPVKHPRLALYTVLNQDEHALTLMAPDCGSWGLPARSTSQRSYVNPMGCESYGFVDRGNIMVSRFLERTLYFKHHNTSKGPNHHTSTKWLKVGIVHLADIESQCLLFGGTATANSTRPPPALAVVR